MIPFILMGSLVTELESPRVASNVVYPSLEEVLAKRKRASEEGHSSSGRGSRRNSGCGRELVDNSVQTTQRFLAEEASAGPREEEEDEVKPPDETEAGKEEENFTEAPKPPTGNSSPGTGSQTALLDKATENDGEGAEQPPTKQEQDTSEDKETTEDKEMTEDKEKAREKAKEEEEETEDKDEETFSQEQRRMKRSRTHSRQVPVCQVQIHALKDLPDIFKEF